MYKGIIFFITFTKIWHYIELQNYLFFIFRSLFGLEILILHSIKEVDKKNAGNRVYKCVWCARTQLKKY